MKKFIIIFIMLAMGGSILFLYLSAHEFRSYPVFQSEFVKKIYYSFRLTQNYVRSVPAFESTAQYLKDNFSSFRFAKELYRSSRKTAPTIYYVDFAGGSDSNDGKSPSTPLKHCPGDPDAGGNASSVELFPGDTVVFKGGVEYRGTVNILWSGELEDKRIIYDGNSAGTFGTGKAIIDGENKWPQGIYSKEKKIKFITIKNFEIKNITEDKHSYVYTSGIFFADENFNIKIENCYIHNVGIWASDGKVDIQGSGIRLVNPRNCEVTGCELTKTGAVGIGTAGAIDCLIAKNNIHDYVRWGIDIEGHTGNTTGNVIRGNTIHDLYQYDIPFWTGNPNNAPHIDFVFIRQGSDQSQRPFGNIVEQNIFYNNYKFTTDYGGTAMVFLSLADRNIIRNNIFINPHSYSTVSFAWGSYENEFYNNIIYSPRTGGLSIRSMESPGGTKIKNNIIIAVSDLIAWESKNDEKGWEINNNYYCSAKPESFHRMKDVAFLTFAQWQKTFGNDMHGGIFKSIDDFKFVDTSGYPTACHTMDLRLQPSSPLVDRGIPLPGFSNDYLGNARPQGRRWDVGPYER